MNISEGQFVGATVIFLIALGAWGIHGIHANEVRLSEAKVEFAKACEARELNIATVNGAWVCMKYTAEQP